MANTTATKKQAEAIKQRMAEIRSDLPYAADGARQQLSQWTDWRYHLARRPVPIIVAAIAAGYWVVPHARTLSTGSGQAGERAKLSDVPPTGGQVDGYRQSQPAPAKQGLVAGAVGTLATLFVKQAAAFAANHVSHLLTQRDKNDRAR